MASVLFPCEGKHNIMTTKIKSNFSLIDNYQKFSKCLDNRDDADSLMGLDQEVPLSPLCDSREMNKQSEINQQSVFCDVPISSFFGNGEYDNRSKTLQTTTMNTNNTTNNSSSIFIVNNNNTNSNSSVNCGNIPMSVYEDEEMSEDSMSSHPHGFSSFLSTAHQSVHNSQRDYKPFSIQQPIQPSPSPLPSPSSSLSHSPSPSALSASVTNQSHTHTSPVPWSSRPSPSPHTATTFQQQQQQSATVTSTTPPPPPLSSSSLFQSSLPSSMSSPVSIAMSSSLTPPSYSPLSLSPSSMSSSLSSSASNISSSSSLSSSLSLSPSPASAMFQDVKPKTFLSELSGSGSTVLTNTIPNFLSTAFGAEASPCHTMEDTSGQYTDLDIMPELSFYDDLMTPGIKEEAGDGRSLPLEMVFGLMREVMEQDRITLNLNHDPHSWDFSEVSRWVKWVCQKNNLADMSGCMSSFSGADLCSWTCDNFTSRFGSAGLNLFQELELWKTEHDVRSSEHQCLDSPNVFLTPSSSPAPSQTSSQGHDDHLLLTTSSPSLDTSSEDEVFYSNNCDTKSDVGKVTSSGFSRQFPFKQTSGRGHKKAITLWQFLLGLLIGTKDHSDCIRWLNRDSRIFKIEDSKKVASLWGEVKGRPAMNYDKLSRSVRQYYKKGIIKKPEQTKRLVYQFCPGIC